MSAAADATSWSAGTVTLIVVGGLLASAFFSGCETGIMSVSRVRLRHGSGSGSWGQLPPGVGDLIRQEFRGGDSQRGGLLHVERVVACGVGGFQVRAHVGT